ncbi:hypothetical protein Mgra_00006124 [Meloidogyne graminicola]|uniref:Uncharacterized protein n=1 Tax=Meloidogyne graminicola TaxID=189291 RepID=A0A8S9ZME0_9BILA|nr:hypothetical protein Mgra_00006124 [Meloidogyne graminicola]
MLTQKQRFACVYFMNFNWATQQRKHGVIYAYRWAMVRSAMPQQKTGSKNSEMGRRT